MRTMPSEYECLIRGECWMKVTLGISDLEIASSSSFFKNILSMQIMNFFIMPITC